MDQIKIGKFIQTLRKNKNLTQAELANKIGVSDRAISNEKMVEVYQIMNIFRIYVKN